jgi:2-C-methyl-D-erythritol 4-phosphate cytidylyltransferase
VKATIKKGRRRRPGYGHSGPPRALGGADPQVFRRQWLEAAYREAAVRGWQATDDAALVEQAGYPVQMVTGEETNIKITTPGDLILARALMAGAT